MAQISNEMSQFVSYINGQIQVQQATSTSPSSKPSAFQFPSSSSNSSFSVQHQTQFLAQPQPPQSAVSPVPSQTICGSPYPINISPRSQYLSPTSMSPTNVSVTPTSSISNQEMTTCYPFVQKPKPVTLRSRLVVLDWDNTLFPTDEVVLSNGKISFQSFDITTWLTFGRTLWQFLSRLTQSYGADNVWIVTNAAESWVFDSLTKASGAYKAFAKQWNASNAAQQYNIFVNAEVDHFAALYNHLKSENGPKIRIISAKNEYKSKYSRGQTMYWKMDAFRNLALRHFGLNKTAKSSNSQDQYYMNQKFVILSIGDSLDEFQAAIEAKSAIVNALKLSMNETQPFCDQVTVQRLKLADNPSLAQMMMQFNCMNHTVINNWHQFGLEFRERPWDPQMPIFPIGLSI